MKIWGIHKKYKELSWWENFMGEHITIGPVTIYGANAMCWAVNIESKKYGYICFTLPSIARRRQKRGWHLYCSPNGTPWASTFYIGSNRSEHVRAKARKYCFGHGFSTNDFRNELGALNNKLSTIAASEREIDDYVKWLEKNNQ